MERITQHDFPQAYDMRLFYRVLKYGLQDRQYGCNVFGLQLPVDKGIWFFLLFFVFVYPTIRDTRRYLQFWTFFPV